MRLILKKGQHTRWCHSFSRRPGTEAADLSGQLSSTEILERVKIVKRALQAKTYLTTAEDEKVVEHAKDREASLTFF